MKIKCIFQNIYRKYICIIKNKPIIMVLKKSRIFFIDNYRYSAYHRTGTLLPFVRYYNLPSRTRSPSRLNSSIHNSQRNADALSRPAAKRRCASALYGIHHGSAHRGPLNGPTTPSQMRGPCPNTSPKCSFDALAPPMGQGRFENRSKRFTQSGLASA